MLSKKLIPLFLALFFLAPSKAEAESPFFMSAGNLKLACEKDHILCESWILGAMDGFEFFRVLAMDPESYNQEPAYFCVDESKDHVGDIRRIFMEEASKLENKDKLDQPAIVYVAIGLNKYRCGRHLEDSAE